MAEGNTEDIDDLNENELLGEDSKEVDQASSSALEDASMVSDEPDIEQIKARVKEMEEEAAKLKELESEVERQYSSVGSWDEKVDADGRSAYIGNVDYSSTAEDLQSHFQSCGTINRITILCDKFTGHPKGFAYVEFADKESVQTALALDDSLFKGRNIKVMPKRTNKPGISSTNRAPRGARARRRYNFGGYGGRRFNPFFRPRRRANFYSPY